MKKIIVDIIYGMIEFILYAFLIILVTYTLVGCSVKTEDEPKENPQELVINTDNDVTGTISVYDTDGSTIFEYYGNYQIKHDGSDTNVVVDLSKDGDVD